MEPTTAPVGGLAQLRLTSAGRSNYSEAEAMVRYSPSRQMEFTAWSTRSSANANLNAYTAFFDNIRWPIMGRISIADVERRAESADRQHANGVRQPRVRVVDSRDSLRLPVFTGERHAGLGRAAQPGLLFPGVCDARPRRRAPLHLPQIQTLDRHPHVQRARPLFADGSPEQSLCADLRTLLQLVRAAVPFQLRFSQ